MHYYTYDEMIQLIKATRYVTFIFHLKYGSLYDNLYSYKSHTHWAQLKYINNENHLYEKTFKELYDNKIIFSILLDIDSSKEIICYINTEFGIIYEPYAKLSMITFEQEKFDYINLMRII